MRGHCIYFGEEVWGIWWGNFGGNLEEEKIKVPEKNIADQAIGVPGVTGLARRARRRLVRWRNGLRRIDR